MNHLKLLLCGLAAAAMFSINVGCQPPTEEDSDVDVSVDTDPGVPEEDSNVTTGTETPDSNVTTGTETPGTETP